MTCARDCLNHISSPDPKAEKAAREELLRECADIPLVHVPRWIRQMVRLATPTSQSRLRSVRSHKKMMGGIDRAARLLFGVAAGAQQESSISPGQSSLQTALTTGSKVQMGKGPLGYLEIGRILVISLFSMVIVVPPDDFGMPQGCSILSTLLFVLTVALVFMYVAGNTWFFEEIINFNVVNSHQADPERVEKQKVLNQTSIALFVVS